SLPTDSLLDSQTHGYPELDRCPVARLADDAAPSTGELRTLAHSHEADVARHANRLRDDEAGAVVADLDANSPVYDLRVHHHVGQQPAQRVLHLSQCVAQLVQLDGLVTSVRVGPAALELELRRSKELQGVVVQRAGETAPRLIAARRDVVEEVPARDHRLFQP